MLPEVSKLLSLDVYRDGGSLSATFSDKNGIQHELILLVKNTIENIEETKEYRSAVIKSFIKSDYLSPITGLTTEKTDIKEEKITWKEAAALIGQIEPHMKCFKSDYLWVINSMSIIANSEKHEIKYS